MNAHTLRLLMKSHRMDVSLLCARANLRREAVTAILSGTKTPNSRESKGLADAFGLAFEDVATPPTPQLDAMPEWKDLQERLFRHGVRYGWNSVASYLVVMTNAWGREEARVKMMERRAQ